MNFLHQIKKYTHLLVMKKVGGLSSMRERLPDIVVALPRQNFPFKADKEFPLMEGPNFAPKVIELS